MLKGNNLILSLNGVRLAASRTCGIERNTDTLEKCSPVDGPAKNFIPTTTSWSISAGGLYANEAGAERLRQIWRAYQKGDSTPIRVKVDTSPNVTEKGDAILTSLHEDGNLNELVKFSIQLQGTGELRTAGVPIAFAIALKGGHFIWNGSSISIEYNREGDSVEYCDIDILVPMKVQFGSVDAYIVVPGDNAYWNTALVEPEGISVMNTRAVAKGGSITPFTLQPGKYVIYACNEESPFDAVMWPE